ncbi:hypothetical protein BCR43DRAFT_510531 [Syncephalastrum racemosum]|uniref:Uncharacterized protein n=1 Tax=Syncephalastrum racemosum TaxID=13706 RepID=A0A1X2HV79_SYNRA|nr:hypothetical protein BCR43DRAFT_510531 [Syncephalastrum racemosum]
MLQPELKNANPTKPAAPAPATVTAPEPAPFQPKFEQRDIPNWSTQQTMPVLRVLDEPEPLVEKKDVPKLKYAPCFETRRKPVHRTNKALWQLWPKAETIDRFRDEQLYDFEENWHRFDDRSSKVYYDKLRAWLKTKIISPIVATVDVVNQHLASTNTTFVECPPPTMALLMLEYQPQGEDSFPISLVYDFITVPKHENNVARQYVLDRIKGMHQRGIFTFYHPNMPSDSETLIHLVYTYLSNRMPHVVPPLVPAQGDTMKFLLLYFYITEELRDEIF